MSPPGPQPGRLTGPRKQLPFEEWPQMDRTAWEGLFREGDLLDDAGAARHWSEATRATNIKHYARWLGWCAAVGRRGAPGGERGPSAPPTATWERATPEAMEAYARALLAEVAPKTVASSLIGLKCVLQRMAPDEDWAWLKRMTNRLKSWARPSRPAPASDLTPPEMFDIALGELTRLSALPHLTARGAMAYRDILLLALLLACPLRRRNLAMMELDRHLVQLEGVAPALRARGDQDRPGAAPHCAGGADPVPRPLSHPPPPRLLGCADPCRGLGGAQGSTHGRGDDLRESQEHEPAPLRHRPQPA